MELLTLDAPSRTPQSHRMADAAPASQGRPPRAMLRLVAASADAAVRIGKSRRPDGDATADDADDETWRRVPRGIGLALLLAIPFWVAIALALAWLL